MPSSAANVSNMGAILKTIWPQDDVQDIFYEDAPLLAKLPKDKDWVGQNRVIAVRYGQINGRSATFSKAKANKQASKNAKMTIETADNFALWSVDHKLMTLSRNDKGAVVRAIESETKSAMKKFKRSVSWMIYGNGGGAIGQVATTTTISSTSLTFRDARSIRDVDVGDILTFSSDDGSGAAPAGIYNGQVEVTGVDPENLVVTVDTALSTAVPNITTASYVFIDGDYAKALYGLEAYVPGTAPSTSVWGMARTTQKRRLGGVRVGGKGLLIEEAVLKALKVGRDEGAQTSDIFMSTDDFLSLDLALGSRRRYSDEKIGNVGFQSIQFTSGGNKPVNVYSDPDCKPGVIWALDLSSWTLASAGDYPDFLDINGQKYRTEELANSMEGRIGGYAQLYTEAPGHNVRLDMSAT